MFLNASAIQAEVDNGRLAIDPFLPELLKPASYVLRAGKRYRVWKRTGKDVVVWSENAAASHITDVIESDELTIEPGTLVLLSSLESVSIPDHLLAMILTTSHVARFGMSCQLGSALISPGFGLAAKQALTLELVSFNPNPIRLRSGTPLCHLLFAPVDGDRAKSSRLRQSVYELSGSPPQPPLLYEEFRGLSLFDE